MQSAAYKLLVPSDRLNEAIQLLDTPGGNAGMRGSVIMPALLGLAAVLVHVRFAVPVGPHRRRISRRELKVDAA